MLKYQSGTIAENRSQKQKWWEEVTYFAYLSEQVLNN